MTIAALQTTSLALGLNRLEYYLKIAQTKGVSLLALPEYALNQFFLELRHTPVGMIEQQSSTQLDALYALSRRYQITIVAPIVRVIEEKVIKSIIVVQDDKISYYDQQILINYPHWNEEKFFHNKIAPLQAPFIFRLDKIKIGIISGFEANFDFFWQEFLKSDVDVVIVPNAATFYSNERWQMLLQTRAFCNNCYVLRINRIGEIKDEDQNIWNFYGDSFLADSNGKIVVRLGSSEELLIATIDKKRIKESKRVWKFRSALKKRGMV